MAAQQSPYTLVRALRYDTDVFTSADGASFWTRPIDNRAFPPTTIKGDIPLTRGVLEIFSSVELTVTAVYTYRDGALEVETITPKSA